MKSTKQISVNGKTVNLKELTVVEVRQWMKDLEKVQTTDFDLVTEGIMQDVSLNDLLRMSDLTMTDLDEMAPSEIDIILATCRELNPHFFQLRDRLVNAARTLPGK
jgi:hypothetical protein